MISSVWNRQLLAITVEHGQYNYKLLDMFPEKTRSGRRYGWASREELDERVYAAAVRSTTVVRQWSLHKCLSVLALCAAISTLTGKQFKSNRRRQCKYVCGTYSKLKYLLQMYIYMHHWPRDPSFPWCIYLDTGSGQCPESHYHLRNSVEVLTEFVSFWN